MWKLKTKFAVEKHSWFPWVWFWRILKYIIGLSIIGAMAWLVIVDQCSC